MVGAAFQPRFGIMLAFQIAAGKPLPRKIFHNLQWAGLYARHHATMQARSRRKVGTVADPTFLEAQTKTNKKKTKCEALINLSAFIFDLTNLNSFQRNIY